MIRANVHSDDYVYEVDFDATLFFEQATSEQLADLIECDFGGDYPADDVARHFDDENQEITTLLDYCRRKDECGFECHVNSDDAAEWLKANRPALYAKIN